MKAFHTRARFKGGISSSVRAQVVTFVGDDGSELFESREKSVEKDPVKILTRLNELRALTS